MLIIVFKYSVRLYKKYKLIRSLQKLAEKVHKIKVKHPLK
jgi:hypothetical protein